MAVEKVLITGMGVVSAAGMNVAETLAGFSSGTRNISQTTPSLSPLDYPVFHVSAPLGDPGRFSSRTVHLTFHALDEALADAGLSQDLSGLRVGVCMGTTVASQLNDMDFYTAYRKTGQPPMEPVTGFLKSNLAEAVAFRVKANGPCVTVVNACSSSADAIGVALGWIRNGQCDLVIAGGGDELSRIPICGFSSLSVFSHEPCRPYDRDRQGLNLGEGAGIVILEPESAARRRGSRASLFVGGYDAACDAHHLTAPRPDGSGLEAAIRGSLAESGIQTQEVGFVNAHGTATRDNDKVEGGVLRVFLAQGSRCFQPRDSPGTPSARPGRSKPRSRPLPCGRGGFPRVRDSRTRMRKFRSVPFGKEPPCPPAMRCPPRLPLAETMPPW